MIPNLISIVSSLFRFALITPNIISFATKNTLFIEFYGKWFSSENVTLNLNFVEYYCYFVSTTENLLFFGGGGILYFYFERKGWLSKIVKNSYLRLSKMI